MIAAKRGSPSSESGEAEIDCESTRPQIILTTGGLSGIGEAEVQPDLLATHFCCCKPGVLCIFCIRWSRKIAGINARRADSLRRQGMGNMMRGAI